MSCVKDNLMFWHTLSWKMANAVYMTMEQPAPTCDVTKLQKQKLYISKVSCSWFQFFYYTSVKWHDAYHSIQPNTVGHFIGTPLLHFHSMVYMHDKNCEVIKTVLDFEVLTVVQLRIRALLGHDAVSLGEWFPIFGNIIWSLTSFSGIMQAMNISVC